ncbi:hypothetical protein C8R44DRAFT_988590 [Mycena epipterygia]|nr:hypothetical protein C8R44DRAFT_988590 [Mycena epipterygia]
MEPATEFPAEIWTRIWYSCSKRDIRNLIFVCRDFRDICQPLLFQHQQFGAPEPFSGLFHHDWITTTRSLHSAKIRLQKLAVSRHVLAVRVWRFYRSLEYDALPAANPHILHIHLIPETQEKVAQVFSSTLGVYQNLRSLHLFGFTIDSPFRQTLSALDRLEELHMAECNIPAREGPLLTLHRLSLTTPSRPWPKPLAADDAADEPLQPLHIASSETLRSLAIDSSHNALAFLSSRANNNFVNLFNLKVDLSNIAVKRSLAFSFLQRCPRVSHIEISCPSTLRGSLPRHLPTTAIPNLRVFRGPPSLAGLIVFNRPVSVVEFSGNFHGKAGLIAGLAGLANSSVPLLSISLNLPMNAVVEIATAIAFSFSELRELSLGLICPPSPRESAEKHYHMEDMENLEAIEWVDDPVHGLIGVPMGQETHSEDDNPQSPAVDERTVELSDNDSLNGDDVSTHYRSQFHTSNFPEWSNPIEVSPTSLPDVLAPGSMYTSSGQITPAPATDVYSNGDPDSQQDLIARICAARVPFPPNLRLLRLIRGGADSRSWPSALLDHHRIILALEAQIPALREVEFADEDGISSVWIRERGVWIQPRSGSVIASLVGSDGNTAGVRTDNSANEGP